MKHLLEHKENSLSARETKQSLQVGTYYNIGVYSRRRATVGPLAIEQELLQHGSSQRLESSMRDHDLGRRTHPWNLKQSHVFLSQDRIRRKLLLDMGGDRSSDRANEL